MNHVETCSIARALALVALAGRVLCAQDYQFRYFRVADGLTNLVVRQVYQDHIGFLWVSTENGIFRYEGDRFEAFGPAQGIPATSGAALGAAPDGSLLAGGDFGLYHLSGNRFEKIPIEGTVSWAQGIQFDGKGHSLIGTDSGLIELSSRPGRNQFQVRRFPRVAGTSGPEAYGVLVEGDVVWYGCGLEICRMDRNGTTVLGRANRLPDRAWLTIRQDGSGNLWVRGRNAGEFVLPRGKTTFQRPDSPYPPEELAGVPAIDADGRILLPTHEGLLIRNETGWKKIGRSAGLRGPVYSAFEDRQNSIWIGLAGQGLARWRGYWEWESYTADSGLANDLVYEILPLPGGPHPRSVLVATEGGLFRGTRGKSGITWKKFAAVGDVAVHSVRLAPGGDVWIGTESHGAARIRADTGSVEWFGEKQGLTGKAPYTLRFDHQARLWAATESGLFVARAPYHSFSRVAELPATRFWTVAESSDGTMWAGGAGGLYEFAAGRWRNYTRSDGLSNLEVLTLGAGTDGGMWIGYRHGGGIDRIRPLTDGVTIEKGVQRPGTDGLVYFLELDPSGRIWAGTERGVDVWDGSHWSHMDTNDGLVWDDCNLHAFAAEPDGTVWIGTGGGLSRFKARPRHSPESPPQVVFTKLVLGRKDVSGQSNPSVSMHSNALTARYSALNAHWGDSVIFRYRLAPVNAAWTETTQRELAFAELSPGTYCLQVEARDNDGGWTGHGAEFAFEIVTPWYRTWWFICSCGLTPLLMTSAVLRLRMLGAKQRERELVRMVEERTADLQRANQDLLRLSSIDPLTGLANRRVFDETLERECARLSRTASAVSLLLLDIDHFKLLNDSAGHQKGDTYLVRVAAELRRFARRDVDVAARYGGEEFALVLPDTNAADAGKFAQSVCLAIAGLKLPHPESPVAPFITVSVGVSTATLEGYRTPSQLVAAADAALYEAKRNGRNRVKLARKGDTDGAPQKAPDTNVLEHA
jgi:diguanylate cyclase (GGDEF)-like protein